MVLWVDKNWRDYKDVSVSAPEEIVKFEYDYIVIAVKRKELADEIRGELIEMGIRESKILWREPAVL